MSFFEKLKNLGPPAPPKRIEENAGYGWPDDEFDEEDGDTYEAPPKCDSPTVKAPPMPVEEDMYLGLKSNPTISHRHAPPPRPMKIAPMKQQQQDSEEVYIDPNCSKPPEVHRNAKPGKKPAPKKPAAPPIRTVPAPAPIPAPPPQYEEDVYLDPNEEQEDSDDVYLEPAEACPPPPRGPMRRPSKPPSDPPPVLKPPVPRAKSSAFLMSAERPAPATGLDVRRSTFPGKLPPPNLASKSPFLAGLKEPKPSPPPPPTKDTFSAGSPTGVKASMTAGREDMDWFAGDCDRKTAEDRLLRINKDGAFLVRRSKAQSSGQPYTLAVFYKGKVYNIPVRYLEETRVYALGKEGKKNEEFFSGLQDIISYHKKNHLLLIDSKSQAKHTTYLTHSARR